MPKRLLPLFIIPALSAHAQTDLAPADSLAREVCLDEVAVVPTVKESTLMRQQPAATTTLSRQRLEASHVTSIKGMSALVPGFFMPDYGSRLTSAIYIRGVGSRTGSPAVGMYVDNVPVADKAAFDAGFFDIERVDVLRGPQGTLYGLGAMGGIVRLYTKNPFAYNGTDVRLSYATGDNHRAASVTHYHRATDNFAFSAGGYYEGGDGFFRNDFTGGKADGLLTAGGRLRGIAKWGDRITVDFSANYEYTDEQAYPYVFLGHLSNPDDAPECKGRITMNRPSTYRRHTASAGANVEYKAPAWTMNAITSVQGLDDRMMLDQDFISRDIYTLEQKQRSLSVSEELTFKNREHSKPARWHWLCGLSGMHQALNTTGPVTFYNDGLRFLESNINALMPSIEQIPMLQRMGFTDMSVGFRGDQLVMDGTFTTPTTDLAIFHQSTVDLTRRLSLTAGLRLGYSFMQMDYAAPADVDYGFRMPNAANARMSIDLNGLSSHISYDGRLRHHHLALLPKIALKYNLCSPSAEEAEDLGNVYATAVMGQRPGGYNLQMFSDLLQGSMRVDMMQGIKDGVAGYLEQLASTIAGMPPTVVGLVTGMMEQNMPQFSAPTVEQVVYRPEHSLNLEVGTHLNLFRRRLQIDAAAYAILTRDLQLSRFAPSGLGRMMVNAGRSRSIGAEASVLYRPDSHWSLRADYAFTDARFTRYDAGDGQDYTGNFVPFVPRHTFHFDAAHTWTFAPQRHARSLTLAADYSGVGRIYWTEANSANDPFYSILGARLQLDIALPSAHHSRTATFQLWSRNLTATRYRTFYFESATRAFEQQGRPLQVGIDVKFSL